MALLDGQISVRDLVMDSVPRPGTVYRVTHQFNPLTMNTRTTGTGPRAWNHGSWSAAEWLGERIVPIGLFIDTASEAEYWAAYQQLAAAMRPIGDVIADVELRYRKGGREYVIFGRPRMAEPELTTAPGGTGFVQCGFVAPNAFIYSAELVEITGIGATTQLGGLSIPTSVPFGIRSRPLGGRATLTNEGTAETGMNLKIWGPISRPSVTLQHVGQDPQRVNVNFDLLDGQWLDIDTKSHKVVLNDVSIRRGQVSIDGDWPLLPPGVSTIRFGASDFQSGTLEVRYRHTWW